MQFIGIQDELYVSINLLNSNAPKLKACNSLHEINVEIEKSFLPEAYWAKILENIL
jgi:hypothetical protein